jgi:hypothetical protein
MSQQPLYEENQIPVDPSSVQQQTAFEPPKLNLQRLKTLQRFFQYATGLLALVFLVLVVFSILKLKDINNTINDQTIVMQQNKVKIDLQRNELQGLINLTNITNGVLDSITKKDPILGNNIQQSIDNKLAQTSDENQIPPRIYLHIVRQDQRSHAAAIGKQLEANGFIVPGIEGVKSIPNSDLRYFDKNDITQTDVKKIHSILLNNSKVPVPPKQVKNTGNIRPRHYEIWFGEDFK